MQITHNYGISSTSSLQTWVVVFPDKMSSDVWSVDFEKNRINWNSVYQGTKLPFIKVEWYDKCFVSIVVNLVYTRIRETRDGYTYLFKFNERTGGHSRDKINF